MRRLFIAGFAITSLVIAIVIAVPWKRALEQQLISALEKHGFSEVSLQVAGVGLHSIVLEDIVFGGENAVRLKNVKIDYSAAGLRARRLESVTILAPTFVVRQQGARWIVQGLESLQASPPSVPLNVASLNKIINQIPVDRVIVENGEMNIQADLWSLSLPLNMTIDKSPDKISYKSNGAHFRKGDIEAESGDMIVDLHFEKDSQTWRGNWQIDKVRVDGVSTPIPLLSGDGTLSAKEDAINIYGSLKSKDEPYKMEFGYDHSFDKTSASLLTLASAEMPWKEGHLKVKDVKIPLGETRALNLNIQVDRVSVDELLGAMTGQRVTATGYVSGTIPVTVTKKGDLIFGAGQLKATGPGMINMPPDAIPGDNKQVALARSILADLNYEALSISLNNDNQGDLGVLMNVEGSNPAVYEGRAVKLNVNLTGDVLDFIQQNVILFTKPQNLWEHNEDK